LCYIGIIVSFIFYSSNFSVKMLSLLVAGSASVVVIWLVSLSLLFSKEDWLNIVYHFTNNSSKENFTFDGSTTFYSDPIKTNINDRFESLPLPNPLFESFSSIPPTSDKNDDSSLKNNTVFGPNTFQPLQRKKIIRKESFGSSQKDINYWKKVTTQKIIHKVEVRASSPVTFPNNETCLLFFLVCHTKGGSYIVMLSSRSLLNIEKIVHSNFPNIRTPPLGDFTKEPTRINNFFNLLFDNPETRTAPEIVQPLLKHIYSRNNRSVTVTQDF